MSVAASKTVILAMLQEGGVHLDPLLLLKLSAANACKAFDVDKKQVLAGC
jgi:hypothetical protein